MTELRKDKDYKAIKRRKKALQVTIRTILIVGLSFVIILPIIKSIVSAITKYEYITFANTQWIPWKTSGQAFLISSSLLDYKRALLRTFLYSFLLMIIQLVIAAFAGYGLHTMRKTSSRVFFFLVLITIIIPAPIIALPQYLFLQGIKTFGPEGLVGKEITVYIIAIFGQGIKQGLFIYLFRQFYKGLPRELEEAAEMDGCGYLGTFFRVILPNAKPIIITVSVFSFVWNFGDTFYSGFFAGDANLLSNKLLAINYDTAGNIFTQFTGIENMNRYYLPVISNASNLLFILPLFILYFIIQRSFVQNFESSGIVG